MKRLIATILLVGLTLAHAAQYDVPNRYPWEKGVTVGVVGGIPTRTNIINVVASYSADNTGATDASTAVQNAINAAANGDVVYLPAGTYRFDAGVTGPISKQITIRGAGPANTVVDFRGSFASAIAFIGGDNYQWPRTAVTFTSYPEKGDTQLHLSDTSAFSVGMYARLFIEDMQDETAIEAGEPPIVNVRGFRRNRQHPIYITGVTSSTVTFHPPLAYDMPESLEPSIAPTDGVVRFCGLEDIKVDGTNSSSGTGLVRFKQSYGCWMTNVEVYNAANYNVHVEDCVAFSMEKCHLERSQVFPDAPSNRAALLIGPVAGALIEHNVFEKQFPLVEINAGSTASVFAYNFLSDVAGNSSAMNLNHGPHNSYLLFEGNVSPNFVSDCYFGSSSEITFFRNWTTCLTSTTADLRTDAFSLSRFCRKDNIVGNIIGKNGAEAYPYKFGYATGFSFYVKGEAKPSGAQGYWRNWKAYGTLTTRTSDTAGVITIHGVPVSVASITRSGTTATVTTSGLSHVALGQFETTAEAYISGADQSEYNGRKTVVPTSDTTYTFTVSGSPATPATGTIVSNALYDTIENNDTLSITWSDASSNGYTIVEVGSLTLTDLTFSFSGSDYTLPEEGSTISVHTGPNGFLERDFDVEEFTNIIGNYNTNDDAIPAGETLSGQTLADSYYLPAKPAEFGSLAWPPFDPTAATPNMSNEAIPAGYYFENGTWPEESGSVSPSYSVGRLRFLRR